MYTVVIFGAGKIARGFIGHLLYLSNISFKFIEKYRPLVDLINERKQYSVHILGAKDKDIVIKGVSSFGYDEAEGVAKAISEALVIFTAIGGKNLLEISQLIANGLKLRVSNGNMDPINIINCENWKKPAEILRNAVMELLDENERAYVETNVGFCESVVMRSAIEPVKEDLELDPLTVNVQNFWELPVDAKALKGKLPEIMGIKPIDSFNGFLERKFYTFNAANGTVSFLGNQKGYIHIADAAHDDYILEILHGVYMETSKALSKKFNFPLEEQLEFTKASFNKLQDYDIVDYIERNARDPIRKLGPDDRLVGSARLVYDQGFVPENLCTAIAAAIYYRQDDDPFAQKLAELRKTEGIDYILENICKLEPNGDLGKLIKQKITKLKEMNIIKGD